MFPILMNAVLSALIVGLILSSVFRVINLFSYWKKRKVVSLSLRQSQSYQMFTSKKSLLEIIRNTYELFPNRRYFGTFQFFRPSLFVRDLDLIKKITVKDFDYFHDHFTVQDETAEPALNSNLFSLKGQRWRDMRSTLSPAFTSSKMRQMFTLMEETASNFTTYLLNNPQKDTEMKELYSKYTNDVIATCAFGIKCDSLRDEGNDFFKMGSYFSNAFKSLLSFRGLLNMLFPKIAQKLGIKVFASNVINFFKGIVTDTIAYREKEGIVRPDMIHLLMEARKGQLKHETESETAGFATVEEHGLTKNNSGLTKIELTDDIVTAQAIIFFIAGFDTSSSILSFLSYQLALNPDIQKKLQEEIDNISRNGEEKIGYDQLLKIKYMDQVVSETLRMYPPGFVLNRICTKPYKIPAQQANETDLLMEKGCLVAIPTYGIHMDPKYFPEPDKFNPERFSEENKEKIVPGSYMPFGSGPRNCIGSRFALLEIKLLMANLLSNFDFVVTEKTQIPLILSKTGMLSSRDGIYLKLEKRQNVKEI